MPSACPRATSAPRPTPASSRCWPPWPRSGSPIGSAGRRGRGWGRAERRRASRAVCLQLLTAVRSWPQGPRRPDFAGALDLAGAVGGECGALWGPRKPHPPPSATARTVARCPRALGELGEGLGHCKRLAVNSGQHRPPIGGVVHQRWGFALCELLQGGLADSIASKHFTGTHMKCPARKPARSPIFTARELYNGRVHRGFHRRLDCG